MLPLLHLRLLPRLRAVVVAAEAVVPPVRAPRVAVVVMAAVVVQPVPLVAALPPLAAPVGLVPAVVVTPQQRRVPASWPMACSC